MLTCPTPPIPLERMPLSEVLGWIEPFTAAAKHELERLAGNAGRIRKPSGAVIIDSDSVPDGLYIVLRGRINLVRQADGREVILAALGPGDVFGENCAFDRQPMQTSAIAATPAELLKIPAGILESHFQRSPETMVRMMRLLQTKLRDAELMASSLALHGVEERLRRTLVRLVRRQGRRAPASPNWILAPVPTQTELARMVGSCRETVSRTLSAMARDGLVSAHGRRMIVDERLLAGAA